MLSVCRIHPITLIASLLLGLTVHAADEVSLRQIIDRHWEAMGGMRAWSQVESLQFNGTVERDGQQVDIVIVKKQPNQIRATVTLPLPGNAEQKLQIIRAHDGNEAWTATRLAGTENMTKETLPTDAASELLLDAGVMPPLLKMWQGNVPLELRDPRRIGHETAYTIRATPTEGAQFDFFVSSEDFRLIGYDSTSAKGKLTKTLISDYLMIEGIRLPSTITIECDATGRSVIHHSSAKVGVGIYNDYFAIGDRPNTARQP